MPTMKRWAFAGLTILAFAVIACGGGGGGGGGGGNGGGPPPGRGPNG